MPLRFTVDIFEEELGTFSRSVHHLCDGEVKGHALSRYCRWQNCSSSPFPNSQLWYGVFARGKIKKGHHANVAWQLPCWHWGDSQMLPWGNIAALWLHHRSERLQRVRQQRSSRLMTSWKPALMKNQSSATGKRHGSRVVAKVGASLSPTGVKSGRAHFSVSLRCVSRLPNIFKSYLNSIPFPSWQTVDIRGFRTRGLRSDAADAHHFNSAPWTLPDLVLLAASDPPFIPARIDIIQPPFGLFPV